MLGIVQKMRNDWKMFCCQQKLFRTEDEDKCSRDARADIILQLGEIRDFLQEHHSTNFKKCFFKMAGAEWKQKKWDMSGVNEANFGRLLKHEKDLKT